MTEHYRNIQPTSSHTEKNSSTLANTGSPSLEQITGHHKLREAEHLFGYLSVGYYLVALCTVGGGVITESVNTVSGRLTTMPGCERPFGRNAGWGCAEARGGIDIYNALCRYVVL
jgi:hypothetical protein